MSWRPVSGFDRVWTGRYDIGGGPVTALAVGLDGDALMVVSAPTDEAELTGLDALGRVTAVVAPNPNHRMGVVAATARWPEARVYAAPAALAKVGEKCPAGRPPAPVGELLLPDGVEVLVPDGMKNPDVVVRVRGEGGVLWYVADLVTNLAELPRNPVLRLVLWAVGFGVGVRPNRFGLRWVLVRDKQAFVAWLRREFAAAPPTVWVPAHGAVIAEPAALVDAIAAELGV